MVACGFAAKYTDTEPACCKFGIGGVTEECVGKVGSGRGENAGNEFDIETGVCMGRQRGLEMDGVGCGMGSEGDETVGNGIVDVGHVA